MKTAETDGTIIEFLLGSHPYDGVWFGDQHPEKEGWFWWRKALRDYASHPSPMSADDWQIIALDEDGTQHQVKHENGSAFTGNYQQCLSFYELVSGKSPMSAEQVEELAEKYADEYYDRQSERVSAIAECIEWENRKHNFIAGYNAATTPSVKSDGWVNVKEKQRLEQIIELKEKERQEWANMCISKQKRIDELENPLKAAPPNVNN